MAFSMLYVTHSAEAEARQLCDQLIERKLIACSNIFPMSSAFWWKGGVARESEWVSIVKTTNEAWTIVRQVIEALHPYEVPCIIRLEAVANEAYEDWIRESVQPEAAH